MPSRASPLLASTSRSTRPFHHFEPVTFDLSRGLIFVAWLRKRTQEWPIDLLVDMEDVLECVRWSGKEADKENDKEKKSAAAAKAGKSRLVIEVICR